MKTLAELRIEDIDEVKAGPETDELVSEAIGLAVICDWSTSCDKLFSAAKTLLSENKGKPDKIEMHCYPKGFGAEFIDLAEKWECLAAGNADTLPLALCRAILTLVKYKEFQGKDSHTPTDKKRVLTNE